MLKREVLFTGQLHSCRLLVLCQDLILAALSNPLGRWPPPPTPHRFKQSKVRSRSEHVRALGCPGRVTDDEHEAAYHGSLTAVS